MLTFIVLSTQGLSMLGLDLLKLHIPPIEETVLWKIAYYGHCSSFSRIFRNTDVDVSMLVMSFPPVPRDGQTPH